MEVIDDLKRGMQNEHSPEGHEVGGGEDILDIDVRAASPQCKL